MASLERLGYAPAVLRISLLLLLGFVVASQPAAWAHGPVHDEVAALSDRITAGAASATEVLRRGELHRLAGELDLAEADYARAARLDPTLARIRLCRGALLLDRGRPAAALQQLKRFLERCPDSPEALRLKARAALALGRPIEAVRALDHAIAASTHPTPDDYLERARILAGRGERFLDEALESLDQAAATLGPLVSLESYAIELERKRANPGAALARLDRIAPRFERRDAVLELRGEHPADAVSSHGVQAAAALPIRGPTGATAVVTRGPYLSVGTPTSLVVRWRTNPSTDSRVRFGTSVGSLTQTQDDATLTTEHEVTLAGLAPDTRYYYSIGTTTEVLAGDDPNHTFVTAPPSGTLKATRLWVIGDSGTANSNAAAVRDAFAAYNGSRPTDLWLMLGDNAYSSGTDTEYQAAVFDMYPAMLRTSVLWPTRGNHDGVYAGSNNDYYDIFTLPTAGEAGGLASGTEAYYSYDYGSIHLVCLDSQGSDRSPQGAMLTWLANDLAATNRDWVIAYWHHPPYTKGSHDSDNDSDSGGRMRDMRQNALPILEAGGVDLVLTGHSHSYERSFLLDGHYGPSSTLTPAMVLDAGDGRVGGDGPYHKPTAGESPHEGAVYTVAGSSGHTSGGPLNHPVMVASLEVLGSLVIDISDDRLDARFLDAAGAIRDSFAILKGAVVAEVPGGPPDAFAVHSVRPNPSGGEARVSFALPAAGRVGLSIVDASGRRVRWLLDEIRAPGPHEVVWDGRDGAGRRAGPGVYFAVLEQGGRISAHKLILAR